MVPSFQHAAGGLRRLLRMGMRQFRSLPDDTYHVAQRCWWGGGGRSNAEPAHSDTPHHGSVCQAPDPDPFLTQQLEEGSTALFQRAIATIIRISAYQRTDQRLWN